MQQLELFCYFALKLWNILLLFGTQPHSLSLCLDFFLLLLIQLYLTVNG